MIVRVAHHQFVSEERRHEAEVNSEGRVRPALAAQPGFLATYYGRTGHLEAYSIAVWEDRAQGEAAAAIMNSQPLLPGQSRDMLPTPDAIAFYDVLAEVVRERVPIVGCLTFKDLADRRAAEIADDWVRNRLLPRLGGLAGLCQAYVLRSLDADQRIVLTFWETAGAMAEGGRSITAWEDAERAARRSPSLVSSATIDLSDLGLAIAAAPSTMPQLVPRAVPQ